MPTDEKATINFQMKNALDKVAFLPFGKLIDQWRWDVFCGKTAPADYNKAWWALRDEVSGRRAAGRAHRAGLRPGREVPRARQTCRTRAISSRASSSSSSTGRCARPRGRKGPLHQCSFYGSKEAGQRLWKMLALGASKPWPDALEVMTGQRQMDASALLEYFAAAAGVAQGAEQGQAVRLVRR